MSSTSTAYILGDGSTMILEFPRQILFSIAASCFMAMPAIALMQASPGASIDITPYVQLGFGGVATMVLSWRLKASDDARAAADSRYATLFSEFQQTIRDNTEAMRTLQASVSMQSQLMADFLKEDKRGESKNVSHP